MVARCRRWAENERVRLCGGVHQGVHALAPEGGGAVKTPVVNSSLAAVVHREEGVPRATTRGG